MIIVITVTVIITIAIIITIMSIKGNISRFPLQDLTNHRMSSSFDFAKGRIKNTNKDISPYPLKMGIHKQK